MVFYQPDNHTLAFWHQIAQHHNLIVIDNSEKSLVQEKQLKEKWLTNILHYQHNQNKGGIAGALNCGLAWAATQQVQWCFLFDQDSRPSLDFFTKMHQQIKQDAADEKTALCSPVYYEHNLSHTADVIELKERKLVRHKYTTIKYQEVVNASYTITSGSCIYLPAWQQIGQYDEGLFLDFVDIDWGLRAGSRGYLIKVFPQIELNHTLGSTPVKFARWQFVCHSPNRHYLYFRNVMLMLRRNYVPWAWKKMELLKLLPRFLVYALCTEHQWQHIKAMLRGLYHGLFRPTLNNLNNNSENQS